jgi:hypothetical protein
MFGDNGFAFKGSALLLLLGGFAMAFGQIVTIAWCSASGEFYGYFYNEAGKLQSCVFNTPGDWLFTYGSIGLTVAGMWSLFYDFVRTRETWKEKRTVNLSRVTFTLSFVVMNSMLEALTKAYMRPHTSSILYILFDNMFWLLPVSIFLLALSAWSIVNKVELYFNLKWRR